LDQIESVAPVVETAETEFHLPASPAVGGLSAFLCLPFLRLRRNRPRELFVCEPFTGDAIHHPMESAGIIGFAGIVAVGFLVEIPEEVKRLNADVGSFDGPLQEAPEILNAVGVNPATNVFMGMVDHFMEITGIEASIGAVSVGVDGGAGHHVPPYLWRKGATTGVWNNLGLHRAMTIGAVPFKQSHDGSFADGPASLDYLFPFGLVHVTGFAADESFVSLNLTGHPTEVAVLHRQADSMEHEPSGLLGDADWVTPMARWIS